MIVKWLVPQNFMKPAKETFKAVLPSTETLLACRSGLTKRMRNSNTSESLRLRAIRDEIDFLIDNL